MSIIGGHFQSVPEKLSRASLGLVDLEILGHHELSFLEDLRDLCSKSENFLATPLLFFSWLWSSILVLTCHRFLMVSTFLQECLRISPIPFPYLECFGVLVYAHFSTLLSGGRSLMVRSGFFFLTDPAPWLYGAGMVLCTIRTPVILSVAAGLVLSVLQNHRFLINSHEIYKLLSSIKFTRSETTIWRRKTRNII